MKTLLTITAFFLVMTVGIWISRLPYFRIATVSIVAPDGSNQLKFADKKRIFEVARPYLTGSFFNVNLHDAQKEAEHVSWVRSARVDRIPPSTVRITVDEYRPAARWIRDGVQAGLISSRGDIFQAAYSGKLPEFDGDVRELPNMLEQYLSFNSQLKPLRLRILRLQYTPRASWTLVLNNGIEVRLGADSLHARLARFVEAYPRDLSKKAAYLDYVDMRYPDAFAVRWRADAPKDETVDEEEIADD